MAPWSASRAKVQLKISIQRLRTLQEKKQSIAKQSRRDIALYIERGKMETARIKTENVINEDIYAELIELLELYCEVLSARFGLLDLPTKEPDPGVAEAVQAIIYAAARTEVKELHVLREMLMHKYGREFSIRVLENQDGLVSERVTQRLAVATPSSELVNAYLSEIAKGYKVSWPPSVVDVMDVKTTDLDTPAVSQSRRGSPPRMNRLEKEEAGEEDEYVALARRLEALKKS